MKGLPVSFPSAIRFAVAVSLVGYHCGIAHAQPKPGYAPSSTHIFPAGGQIGTTVAVRVGTECAPPNCRFEIDGVGISAARLLGAEIHDQGEPSPRRVPTETPITYPRQWSSTIHIDKDAQPGTAFWRIGCAQGGTASRPFVIGRLPEHIETESNSTLQRAESVAYPLTVNGQIHGERDVDFYRLQLSAGETVTFEVVARRIGSKLDPVISILDRQGRPVRVDRAFIGADPVVVLEAPDDGEFYLRMSAIGVLGDPSYVYRVNIEPGAFVSSSFPAAGQPASNSAVQMHVVDGTGQQRVVNRSVHFPAGPDAAFVWSDPEQELRETVLYTDSRQQLLESERDEESPVNRELKPGSYALGRFRMPDDRDTWTFQAGEAAVDFECEAFPAGSEALPVLQIVDAEGKTLARSTPQAERPGLCRLQWKAPTPGTYRLIAQDLRYGSRGDHRFAYRLSMHDSKPDFQLFAATDTLNVEQERSGKLRVTVRRLGHFDGAVRLQATPLGDGIELQQTEIPAKKSYVDLEWKLSAAIASDTYRIQLTGTAEIDGQDVIRPVWCRHQGYDDEGHAYGPSHVTDFHLAVTHKPVFRLYCQEAYQYAHRGSVFLYPMQFERLDGFSSPIRLQIGDRQNRDLDGIQMREVTLAPDQTEIDLPIYLPETMAINVQSQSQLYCQAHATFQDAHGVTQTVLVLSEKRNMLRTLPPVAKLQAVQESVRCPAGEVISVPLRLERTSLFTAPMTLTLVDPPIGIQLRGQSLPAAADECELTLLTTEELEPGPHLITVRGTGFMDGIEIVSETQIQLLAGDTSP